MKYLYIIFIFFAFSVASCKSTSNKNIEFDDSAKDIKVADTTVINEEAEDSLSQILSKRDTSFARVDLHDHSEESKTAVIEIGQKAVIYLKVELLRKEAVEIRNDFNNEPISKIIKLLDSKSKKKDTIFIDPYLPHLEYLVSRQLEKGNAKVFYKKNNVFVPVIYHRLERYGSYAYRFFYLPDKRPFFSAMEMSGILDERTYLGLSDSNELEELGRKLQDLAKE